jgi:hypothetical protein
VSAASPELLLGDALRREWLAQSDGERPLVVSGAVRDAVELAVAPAGGALDVAAALPAEAASPEDLLDRLRDWLPDRLDPWSARTLARVTADPGAGPPAWAPPPGVHEIRFVQPPPDEPASPPRARVTAGAAAGALLAVLARRLRR